MKNLKQIHLIAIFAGAVIGVLVGCFLPEWGIRSGFLGELFLNALKMLVLPLVMTSMIVGVANLESTKHLGSLGLKTFVFYTVTTGLAVLTGIFIVNLINPGVGASALSHEVPERILNKEAFSFMDVVLGMVHPNLIQAASEFKILPMIFISILTGISVIVIGEKARPFREFIASSNEIVMKMVDWVIFFTPIGVFGLIAQKLGNAGGGEAVFQLIASLGKYCFSVVAGLLVHGVIVLPILLFIFSGRNPFLYFTQMIEALMTAFATASSSATLPVSMECTQKEAGVSQKTSSVVMPLGATVNMDGTALYEAVAAIFIAQSYGIVLGFPEQLIIVFTATMASVGAAGIPEAGLVTMIMVLESVGLPIEGIGLILAVDWLLDRCRTTVNVWGDAVAAAVIDRWEKVS